MSVASTGAVRPPTFSDVLAARERIAPFLRPTPLYRYAALSELVGTEAWVKHENHQPIGAFKIRGGVNLVAALDGDGGPRELVTASTGNHGQPIAYAARLFGFAATVCVPEGANPVKVDAIRALGATIVVHGRDFDDAREHAERLAAASGGRYVHPADEPLLIAGVGTAALEILEELPEVDVVIVPIGGGTSAAGACLVANALRRETRVIGVQSEAAPASYRSWVARRLVEHRTETFAEGLATRVAYEVTQPILWKLLDDFVLVGEDELRAAVVHLLETTRNVAEPSGAAPLAAALRLRSQIAGCRVALVLSGGNISVAQLRELLA